MVNVSSTLDFYGTRETEQKTELFCLQSKTIFESIIRQNKLLTLITHVDFYSIDYVYAEGLKELTFLLGVWTT